MKLDPTFERELKKAANGDGTFDYKFEMLKLASTAAQEMSTPAIVRAFNTYLRRYGRAIIALCVAATILDRADRLSPGAVAWAHQVLTMWTNRGTTSTSRLIIRDGLHPTRIEEYAGGLIKHTSRQDGRAAP